MSCAGRARGLGCLAVLLLLFQAPVHAQDSARAGADLGPGFDALLNAAPSVAATERASHGRGVGAASRSGRAERRTRRQRAAEARSPATQRTSGPRTAPEKTGEEIAPPRAKKHAPHTDAESAKRALRAGPATRASQAEESSQAEPAEKAPRAAAKKHRSRRGAVEARKARTESARRDDEGSAPPRAARAGNQNYEELKRSWHAPWPEAADERAAPSLTLHPVAHAATPTVLSPEGPEGGFGEEQLAAASEAFGSWKGGPRVAPRLLDLIYHAALHFGVSHVHLISGVRHDRSGSRHSHGLAADIVLPGIEDDELATYFRAQGFVGVGIYTRAGFVHVDVRERSFFWLDRSPPGRRTKIVPERADEAKQADEAAIARGQSGYVNPPRLQKALHARHKRRMRRAKSAQ